MKKILILSLALILALSLTACGSSGASGGGLGDFNVGGSSAPGQTNGGDQTQQPGNSTKLTGTWVNSIHIESSGSSRYNFQKYVFKNDGTFECEGVYAHFMAGGEYAWGGTSVSSWKRAGRYKILNNSVEFSNVTEAKRALTQTNNITQEDWQNINSAFRLFNGIEWSKAEPKENEILEFGFFDNDYFWIGKYDNVYNKEGMEHGSPAMLRTYLDNIPLPKGLTPNEKRGIEDQGFIYEYTLIFNNPISDDQIVAHLDALVSAGYGKEYKIDEYRYIGGIETCTINFNTEINGIPVTFEMNLNALSSRTTIVYCVSIGHDGNWAVWQY